MTTVIADCNSGNMHSAQKAFQLMARETGAGGVEVTFDPERIADADRLVLPGVGAFADCKAEILKRDGMAEAITECVREKGAPFLGICVGMQLLASLGREHGTTEGFDWISGEVVEIAPGDPSLKVPHMGWNNLAVERKHPLFSEVGNGAHAYFVHSFHFVAKQASDRIAYVDYGSEVTAAVASGNIAGVQFHPEKSQATGLRIISNFLRWKP